MTPIRYFDFDKKKVTQSEWKVLEHLKKAGETIHDIWQKQIDPETGDLLLYPEGLSEEDIIKAAEDNPALLGSYTAVIKNGDELKAIPYSEAYKEDLEKFYGYLEQASNTSEDDELKTYIQKIIKAFKENDFDSALFAYLENRSKIEFLCGPLETYEDKLFGKKRTFQFNLRIMQTDPTSDIDQMIDVMRHIRLRQPETSVGTSVDKVNIYVRIDDVLMFAGRQSKFLVSSTNLPNEPELVRKYGTKVVVYTTSMSKKFDELHKPILPLVKGDGLGDSVDEMRKAMFKGIALHEIAEGTVKFEGMSERLGKHIDYVRELNADLVGMDSAKYYVLNGLISLDEYMYLLTALLIFAIDMCNQFRDTGELNDYVIGDAVLFNRLFESKALTKKDNELHIDFTLLAKDIEFLSQLTLGILEDGHHDDAEKLLDQYGDRSVFEKLPKA